MIVATTFAIAGYVGYYYEDVVVQLGLVDPKKLNRDKQKRKHDNNPLPIELRDEYVEFA